MKRHLFLMLIPAMLLLSCSSGVTVSPAIQATAEDMETDIPDAATEIMIPTFTPQPEVGDRPVFLMWPLPAYIGLARISQYPNSPWTWNYLGLNAGQQCPPMFGYLLNVDSWPYWRDPSIPEDQDKAQADPHNFEMVACYSTDGNIGANGHEGTDIKAPAETPVYAVADGRVMEWRPDGLNSMIVLKHCLGGNWGETNQCDGGELWYTTYMHIVTNKELLVENLAVPMGTQVGVIHDQTINSHLHFEVGREKRGYTNFVNPWGRDEAPWLGCMWMDQSLCVTPDSSHNRIATITNTGQLSIQQGELHVQLQDTPAIRQIRLWDDRILVLDMEGNLLLREGPYSDTTDSFLTWNLIASGVLDVQVTDQRLASLNMDGNLYVLEGGTDNPWSLQAEHIRAYSISDHRIGILDASGNLLVRQDGQGSEWKLLANGVSAFQLNDNRIAMTDLQGNLLVNEGDLNAEWQLMAGNVKAFQLTNLRLGILDAQGRLMVKEGNLRAGWITIAEQISAFQLSNYRLLVQNANGVFGYQHGNLYQPLEWLAQNVQGMYLNDGIPVIIP
ncbi:MAG TPA: M23 family metallopeptidase [Anaerolineales bacterium]|nr:M23 family metallopeptidase [Anaerolineales bacterium]